MHISERIKNRMGSLALKPKDIVNRIGVSKATVSQWVNGNSAPEGQNLLHLAETLEVTPDWLLTGRKALGEGNPPSISSEIVRHSVRIVRHSEIISGKYYSPDEFADRAVDVCFRLENNLGLGDLLSKGNGDRSLMKKAAIMAQRTLDKVLSKPRLKITDEQKYQLYAEILDDAYQAILLEIELDEKKYIERA